MKQTPKKLLIACLILLSCTFIFTACSDKQQTTGTAPLSAQEQLTEKERQLFDALIKMTTEDFYEPSEVRVLDVGNYAERTQYVDDVFKDTDYGPDTVVVRLQGENRVGGTLNNYYKVCIVAAENTSTYAQKEIDFYESLMRWGTGNYKDEILDYKGDVGDYAEVSGIGESASDTFDIGKINKALKEYWEELGF